MDTLDDAENWMRGMRNVLCSRRLLDVRLPGTHHSDSYMFNGDLPLLSCVSVRLGKCQSIDITTQLNNGIRHLDLRPGSYNKNIRSVHGPSWLARGDLFERHLDQIKTFLDVHPYEFLIVTIEMTTTSPLDDIQKSELRSMIITRFAPYMVTLKDKVDMTKVTMGTLWNLGRRVWVMVEAGLLPSNENNELNGLWDLCSTFSKGNKRAAEPEVKRLREDGHSNRYTSNILDLATALLTTQAQHNQLSYDQLFASSLYNDPFGPGWFTGKPSSPYVWGPNTFSRRVCEEGDIRVWYRELIYQQQPQFRINIVDVDFCEQDQLFINLVINSNIYFESPVPTEVHTATETSRAYVDGSSYNAKQPLPTILRFSSTNTCAHEDILSVHVGVHADVRTSVDEISATAMIDHRGTPNEHIPELLAPSVSQTSLSHASMNISTPTERSDSVVTASLMNK
eukprot:CFRG7218T1